jgi:epoxyqueuosine reductase
MDMNRFNHEEVQAEVTRLVAAAGLRLFGMVSLDPDGGAFGRFQRWLADGRHAGMSYLKAHLELREDPRRLLAGARAALVVGLPYSLGDRLPRRGETPRIAQYARLADYHKILWRKGDGILAELHARFGPGAVGRVVTDSAPLLERSLAAKSGGGFIGKNTCFIDPEAGSFFLLGELLTTLPLPTAEAEPIDPAKRSVRGGCGPCRRCQVHCPTGALNQDYTLDANQCLAYWTIEHRGTIPERFWPWLELYVFGCDICQLVCPYNRKANPSAGRDLARLKETPPLFAIATMTQEDYERMFAGTPMTRAKRGGLMRNALIAMTVTKDPRLEEALRLAAERGAGEEVVLATIGQIRGYRP